MIFGFKNCSNLLLEKNVQAIKKKTVGYFEEMWPFQNI